jgi:hypothetical protein
MTVSEALSLLESGGFIHLTAVHPEVEYAFRHALVGCSAVIAMPAPKNVTYPTPHLSLAFRLVRISQASPGLAVSLFVGCSIPETAGLSP